MNDTDIKNALEIIFNSLFDEDKAMEKDLESIFNKVVNSKRNFKDMELFNIFLMDRIDDALRILVGRLNPDSDRNKGKFNRLHFIYTNYGFLKSNLVFVVSQREGDACCVDKTRWLINAYRDYILEDILPDIKIGEKCYWKPGFGSGKQWMDFCDGLVHLYYGRPLQYLETIRELLAA